MDLASLQRSQRLGTLPSLFESSEAKAHCFKKGDDAAFVSSDNPQVYEFYTYFSMLVLMLI